MGSLLLGDQPFLGVTLLRSLFRDNGDPHLQFSD